MMFIDLSKYIDLDHFGVYPVCILTPRGSASMVCMEWNGETMFRGTTIDRDNNEALSEFLSAMFHEFLVELGR